MQKKETGEPRPYVRPTMQRRENTERFANFLGSWRISWASYDNYNSCGFIHGYMLVPAGTATLLLLLTTVVMFFLPISHCLRPLCRCLDSGVFSVYLHPTLRRYSISSVIPADFQWPSTHDMRDAELPWATHGGIRPCHVPIRRGAFSQLHRYCARRDKVSWYMYV